MTEWFRSRERDDWWLYAVLAGGALVMGVVVWFIATTYEPPPSEGTVIEREFDPAHTENYMQAHYRSVPYTTTQCTGGYGDTPQTCRTVTNYRTETYYLPATRHVPDDWDIRIQACETNDEGEEKCRTGWIDVSREVHDQCEIGRYYRKETQCLPQ